MSGGGELGLVRVGPARVVVGEVAGEGERPEREQCRDEQAGLEGLQLRDAVVLDDGGRGGVVEAWGPAC